MTNPAQIAASLEALAAKASPPNWRLSSASMDGFCPIMAPGGAIVAMMSKLTFNHVNDAALIVALRNNLPTIISALKAMEEQTDGE